MNIAIFFDTNIIESRFSYGKIDYMFLSKINPSTLFHQIQKHINQYKDIHTIDLYISEISLQELSFQMVENFHTNKEHFSKHKEAYQKSYGDIFNLSYEFRCETKEDYSSYLGNIIEDFLDAYGCNILYYPKEIDFFESLISKCIQKQKPFQTAKGGNRKEYHDAGFKDAIIYSSIENFQKIHNIPCIFVTLDTDFMDTDNILICNDIDTFSKIINRLLGTELYIHTSIKCTLENDYNKESIVNATGNEFDESVTRFEVMQLEPTDLDNIYRVNIAMTINETDYNIECEFDMGANEIISTKYSIINE